jgi:hypothetical protein
VLPTAVPCFFLTQSLGAIHQIKNLPAPHTLSKCVQQGRSEEAMCVVVSVGAGIMHSENQQNKGQSQELCEVLATWCQVSLRLRLGVRSTHARR